MSSSHPRNALSIPERLSYISAVQCLIAKTPALTPTSKIPGARTRYDDFISAHLLQTPFVHASGLFLAFHRYYVHLYETALRTECGYRGAQPYWDWTLSYKDPRQAAIFDGSPWSMGGNGKYIPGREPTLVRLTPDLAFNIEPGTGGGCIEQGPFREGKYEIRLGPVGIEPQGPDGGLGYNPRCLARDLGLKYSSDTRPTNVTKLLDGCADLACFNVQLDTPGGVHGSGHFSLGGIELDTFSSPSDPMFWLHHAQIDRLWTIWQARNPSGRLNQVWGTGTAGNCKFCYCCSLHLVQGVSADLLLVPPSANVTLDSTIDFEILSAPKTIRELVSSIDGELCYIYE